jgi:hypothetical protein
MADVAVFLKLTRKLAAFELVGRLRLSGCHVEDASIDGTLIFA